MRQVRLWHDDGWRICLVVSHGRKATHLLHVPSLEHIKVPVAEFARQERAGKVQDIPVTRGLKRRIRFRLREARRHGRRCSEAFAQEVLAMLRTETAARPDPDDPDDEPEPEPMPEGDPPEDLPEITEPPQIGLTFAQMTRAVCPPGRIKPKKTQRTLDALPLFRGMGDAAF